MSLPDTSHDDEDIQEYKPDYSLKEKIGKDISMNEILSTGNVQKSQEVIDASRDDFITWVENDLREAEELYSVAASDPASAEAYISEIQNTAFSIKSQSGTFGYDFGSAVAKSLYDFCENNYVVGDANHIRIIRKHLDTLRVTFKRRISGDGGKIGGDVLNALHKLVQKFDHPDA